LCAGTASGVVMPSCCGKDEERGVGAGVEADEEGRVRDKAERKEMEDRRGGTSFEAAKKTSDTLRHSDRARSTSTATHGDPRLK
jgi:hypothetical protein